jgi:hypothetical protein
MIYIDLRRVVANADDSSHLHARREVATLLSHLMPISTASRVAGGGVS